MNRKRRGESSNSEISQTLNALLQRMDGIDSTKGIIVIGATNQLSELDEALTRPGRFDRKLYIGPPRLKSDRDEIVKLYLDQKKLSDDVTLEKASHLMVGLTGAEIEEVLNSAVYNSLRENREGVINLNDIDRGVMNLHTQGVPVETSSKRDKEIAAVHEAGHCLISLLNNRDVLKVSVVPYSSGIGGVTMPNLEKEEDNQFKFQSEQEIDLMILLGGMAAEEVIYGEHSQGASNDIEKATELSVSLINSLGYQKRNDKYDLVNRTTLSKKGFFVDYDKVTEEANDLLNEFLKKDIDLLKNNENILANLKDKLIKEDTVLYPTLDKLCSSR